MRSTPTDRRSIAAHLVLLFTVAATLLLCAGIGVLFWIVTAHAEEEDDTVFNDKIAALRADLAAPDGVAVVCRELQRTRTGERAYLIRILDANDQLIAESAGMSDALVPQRFASAGERQHLVLRSGGRLFSIAAFEAESPPSARYNLQVAQDRTMDAEFSRELLVLLGAVAVIGAIAAAVIAQRVARRGLQPLDEMTLTVREIGAQQLDRSVPVELTPRELQPLARAFNEMLERLHESFTRLSQFSADLAHELRTPVANIRGEAEVALTRARSADEYRHVVESTAVECERLSCIIDSLLFLARAQAADRKVDRMKFDGRGAVEKIIAAYASAAEEHGVAITCTGDAMIYADPTLFSRALANLIDNALRFTPSGGRIAVQISDTSGKTMISVEDNGAGIAPQHLPRVFDRFYRGDPSRSTAGTGLGLALVKSIAELHGGTAAVESNANGTVVRITFGRPR